MKVLVDYNKFNCTIYLIIILLYDTSESWMKLWIGMRDRTMRGKMKVLIIDDNIFNYNM